MWYCNDPAAFPAAVANVALSAGTSVGAYEIITPLLVEGRELYYSAQHPDGERILCELLPMQWCFRQDGVFVPYHAVARETWEQVRSALRKRLETLQRLSGESALPQICDIFEEHGTLWYAFPPPFGDALQGGDCPPADAIAKLTPVMDTLSGLHEQGICHGAMTEETVRISTAGCLLLGWCNGTDTAAPVGDVQAVSRLLCRMMTGDPDCQSPAAKALPRRIRNALYNGSQDPAMTIPSLWKQLHTASPVKCYRPHMSAQALHTRLTAGFCAVCLAAPPACWGVQSLLQTAALPDVSYTLTGEEQQLPALLSMPLAEAEALLSEMGLQMVLTARENNPVIPEDCVVTQQPEAGAVVRPGDTVLLGLSNGWSNYVPDVRNMLLADAKKRLEELGFQVTSEGVPSISDAPGTVMAQDAAPDTKLLRDSTIHLTVSLGREDLDVNRLETVGNYVGMDFEDAKQALSASYLYALQVETVYDKEIPAGVIIAQDIPEGRQVPQGTTIGMKVSLGVEMTRAPGVVRMRAAEARAAIEKAGLKCVMCYISDSNVMDCVLSQNIAEGTRIPVDTEIWLTVSIGTDSHVLSTGGWSGAPLPTVSTEETSETAVQITTETVTTETDMTEPSTEPETESTETTDPSEETPSTDATEFSTETIPTETLTDTGSTEDSEDSTETSSEETEGATSDAPPEETETQEMSESPSE